MVHHHYCHQDSKSVIDLAIEEIKSANEAQLATIPEFADFAPLIGDTYVPDSVGLKVEVLLNSNKTIFVDFPEDTAKSPLISVKNTGDFTLTVNGQLFKPQKNDVSFLVCVYTFGQWRIEGRKVNGVIITREPEDVADVEGADMLFDYEAENVASCEIYVDDVAPVAGKPFKLFKNVTDTVAVCWVLTGFDGVKVKTHTAKGTVGEAHVPVVADIAPVTISKGENVTITPIISDALPSAPLTHRWKNSSNVVISTSPSLTLTGQIDDLDGTYQAFNSEGGSNIVPFSITAEGAEQPAPVFGAASDENNTQAVIITTGKTIADFRYTINGGETLTSTFNPLRLPNDNIPPGSLLGWWIGTNTLNESAKTPNTFNFTNTKIAQSPPTVTFNTTNRTATIGTLASGKTLADVRIKINGGSAVTPTTFTNPYGDEAIEIGGYEVYYVTNSLQLESPHTTNTVKLDPLIPTMPHISNFTGAANTLLKDYVNTGIRWLEIPGLGSFKLNGSGRAVLNAAATDGVSTAQWFFTGTTGNYYIKLVGSVATGGNLGAWFNITDKDNYQVAVITPTGLTIYTVVNGAGSPIGFVDFVPGNTDHEYIFRINKNFNKIGVEIDEAVIRQENTGIEFTATTGNAVGFGSTSPATISLDSFESYLY